MYIELPPTKLAVGTKVLHLHLPNNKEQRTEFIMAGPEHLRITGNNGSGKTTLLNHIVQGKEHKNPDTTVEYVLGSVGFIRQRIEFDPQLTVLETVLERLPHWQPQDVRDQLAQLRFHNDTVHQHMSQLSGGERFRVEFACNALAAPQLLILDEPTNNLDISTTQWLIDALASYNGALIVVSHDDDFCEQIGIDYTITLESHSAT